MIITCPHCQTKYQVAYEAIGSAGRKVQCAHCRQAWRQGPPAPKQTDISDAMTEDGLDEAMAAEERLVAAETAKRLALEAASAANAPRTPAALKAEIAMLRQRQKDFRRRQSAISADLPLARLRRTLRIIGTLLLVGLLATAYFGRVQVVKRFPDMAGVYEAVGLGVNVVGLDFSNVSSLRTLRDGKEVLVVSAQIVGLLPGPIAVPAVVVTLLDANGNGIYEWSVAPAIRDLMAGERAAFNTQLSTPPGDAMRVRLSFAGAQNIPLATGEHSPGVPAQATGHPAPTLDPSLPEHP